MVNKLNIFLLFVLISLFAINFTSADLGSFNPNTNLSIRVLANCSVINITEVTSPNQTFVLNEPMTALGGQTFSYYFSNTSSIGHYTYSWNNPCIDCSTGECGNSFDIGTISNPIIYIVFLIASLFLFGLTLYGAIRVKWGHEKQDGKIISVNKLRYFKPLLFALAYIQLMWIAGILSSIFTNYLQNDNISALFYWMYLIMLDMLIPITICALLFSLIVLFQDRQLRKRIFRGASK